MGVVFDLTGSLAEELLDDFPDQLDLRDLKIAPAVCVILIVLSVLLHTL